MSLHRDDVYMCKSFCSFLRPRDVNDKRCNQATTNFLILRRNCVVHCFIAAGADSKKHLSGMVCVSGSQPVHRGAQACCETFSSVP